MASSPSMKSKDSLHAALLNFINLSLHRASAWWACRTQGPTLLDQQQAERGPEIPVGGVGRYMGDPPGDDSADCCCEPEGVGRARGAMEGAVTNTWGEISEAAGEMLCLCCAWPREAASRGRFRKSLSMKWATRHSLAMACTQHCVRLPTALPCGPG